MNIPNQLILNDNATIKRAVIFYLFLFALALCCFSAIIYMKNYFHTNNYAVPGYFQGKWHEYDSECNDINSILLVSGNTIRYDKMDFIGNKTKYIDNGKIIISGLSYEKGDPIFRELIINYKKNKNLIFLSQLNNNMLVKFKRCGDEQIE